MSIDRLLLGDVPLFSRERKVLFVRNHSSQHKVSFSWHLTNPDHIKVRNLFLLISYLACIYKYYSIFQFSLYSSKYIRIQPSKGVLDQNKSKLCKITFISRDVPSFYNIDLICEVCFEFFSGFLKIKLSISILKFSS